MAGQIQKHGILVQGALDRFRHEGAEFLLGLTDTDGFEGAGLRLAPEDAFHCLAIVGVVAAGMAKGAVDVFSYGADGQSGGEGRDADIGSWQ